MLPVCASPNLTGHHTHTASLEYACICGALHSLYVLCYITCCILLLSRVSLLPLQFIWHVSMSSWRNLSLVLGGTAWMDIKTQTHFNLQQGEGWWNMCVCRVKSLWICVCVRVCAGSRGVSQHVHTSSASMFPHTSINVLLLPTLHWRCITLLI